MPTSPSRRALLAALTAAATAPLAGCSTPWGTVRVQPLGGDPAPPAPGPDELARRRAVSGVRSALAALGSTADADAAVRTALGEQLKALGEQSATGTPTSTPAVPDSVSPSASPAPVDPLSALQATARTAREDVAGVASGTARLLACVAAGCDVAADLLAESTGTGLTTPSQPASDRASDRAPSTSTAPAATASPTGSGTTPAESGEQAALTAALAVEEQARYGYGVLAVRLSGDQRSRAVADLAAHDDRVDALRARLEQLGAQPPAPQPAWALPSAVTDAAGAVSLAVTLEGATTAAAADLVAGSLRERRADAAADLATAAVRWQWWRAASGATDLVALPGLTGR